MGHRVRLLPRPSKLGVERNILRYVPTQVLVRADESASAAETLRVVLAGLAANAPVALSVGKDLPVDVRGVLENKGIKYEVKSDAQFREYLASNAKTPVRALAGTSLEGTRIRYIGNDEKSIYSALGGRPDVAVYFAPVTEAGTVSRCCPSSASRLFRLPHTVSVTRTASPSASFLPAKAL